MDTQARHLSKYQLIECIARGGMGEVWKALDTQLKRYVAIKLLHPSIQQYPDFITRFEQEARLVASLRHPNIVQIHDFKIDNRKISYSSESEPPLCYMVMDYVPGETLADYIRNTSYCGQFPSASDIVYIFTVIGLALDYAHQCGMIHRDIKPANILLDQRIPTARSMGEPILTDFGIARQRGVAGGTIIGSVIGTPKYIPPEQAQGQYDDPRSDLYSLGIILYEIMTGMTPFQADTPLAIVMQHLHEKPKSPELINPRISQALSEVILKSIAKDPNERFPTGAAMAVALANTFNISTPEQLGRSGGHLPSDSSSSSSPVSPTNVPPLALSNGVQTPFVGLPLEQTRLLSDPQSNQLTMMPHGLAGTQRQVNVIPDKLQQKRAAKQSQFSNKKKWVIGLTALLMLVLLGSGLTTLMFLLRGNPFEVNKGSGHMSFVKSGSSQAYNAVQIDMTNLSELPQGMAYYGWIRLENGMESENTILPHWKLTVSQQAIHTAPLTYPGFDNLYAPHSLFLITKESTASPPIIPNIDLQARLYYTTVTTNPSTALDLKPCPTGGTYTVCSSF
ncbi:MAG TPA: serine/threonine-protein kinase [Ktedonobacteraceae bacterium]|jgi:serine/threonine protein kinase